MTEPPPTLYECLGGEAGVRALADRFYDVVESDYADLRGMLPSDTTNSRRKLFMYLSGWLGGPQLYLEAYGHPRLRLRHLPFPIDEVGVRHWLEAMESALRSTEVEAEVVDILMARFAPLAHHMVNRI